MLQTYDGYDNVIIAASIHLSIPSTRDILDHVIMSNNSSNLVQLFENHFEPLSNNFIFIAQQNNINISLAQRLILQSIKQEIIQKNEWR